MNTTTLNFDPGLAYADFRHARGAYFLAALVAFVMSSYFVVGYLAGSLLFWDWNVSQWMNGLAGLGLCAVMTLYQFTLYAQGDVEGGKKATIIAVCVAVSFSLLSEIGQGMERDNVRMETKSLESPTYKALVDKVGTAASGAVAHPYSASLAQAEMKLARCQQKVDAGIWKDCIESTARLNSIERQVDRFYQQNESGAVALAKVAKTMEKDESNYHPLVNLIRDIVNSTGVFASFLLSLFLISCFEYAFHYLGKKYAQKRDALIANGYDITRRVRKTPKQVLTTKKEITETPETRTPKHDTRTEGVRVDTDDSGVRVDTDNTDGDVITEEMQARYNINEGKKAGDDVYCPWCETEFKKRTYNHRFCQPKCKDDWHNAVKPERLQHKKGKA